MPCVRTPVRGMTSVAADQDNVKKRDPRVAVEQHNRSITEGVGQRARESAISTPHPAHELPHRCVKVVVKGAVSEKP